jgi:hypothetical protein
MTRHPFILIALAGALMLAACGSTKSPSTASRQDDAFEGALKFAKCMREHGVDMPDPTRDSKGGIRITARSGPGDKVRTDAGMKAAQDACSKYMKAGGGEAMDPKRQAEMQDAQLAYARCMRKEGIDMPDPKFDGGGVQFKMRERGQGGVDPESAAFKAADKTCHHLLGDDAGFGVSKQAKP